MIWEEVFKQVDWNTPYLRSERRRNAVEVYPQSTNVFRAFKITPFKDVKIVILGQDPYSTPGYANGLAFSVNAGVEVPQSLKNIFKELREDIKAIPPQPNLLNWAEQGVLLLNTVLTVEKGEPNSHKNFGWQEVTDHVIETLSKAKSNLVFFLWGNNAINKKGWISGNHLIIESPHPSPLSAHRGFFGSKPFSRANEYLKEHNLKEIEW